MKKKYQYLNLIYEKILDIQTDLDKLYSDYYKELDLICVNRIECYIEGALYNMEDLMQYVDSKETDTLLMSKDGK